MEARMTLAEYDAEQVKDSLEKLHLGDWVQALAPLFGLVRQGAVGEVMTTATAEAPAMVLWHAADEFCPVMAEDVEVLCGEGFAASEELTPKRKRAVYTRRGAV